MYKLIILYKWYIYILIILINVYLYRKYIYRRAWPPGDIHRPVKRLFTPEIKRMLKDWLVRRRDNPYPSREEKKALAIKTGLTYTQV